MQEVSHDKEDIQDESNAIPKEALQLLDARWSEWKEAEKEKRKTIWKTLRRELKALDCHKGVKGNAWRIQADVSILHVPNEKWTDWCRFIKNGFGTRAE